MTGTAAVNEGFHMTELGLVPCDWEVVKLGDVAYFETGRRMKGGALENGEILSLGGEHIANAGSIDLSKPKFISKDFYDGLGKGKLQNDDVIICKDGARTGKVAYIKFIHGQYMAVNEHVFIVRSKNDRVLCNQFIYYFLFSALGQSQVREAYHGLIGGITNSNISNFKILLPSIPEQKKIAYVLSAVQEAKEKTEVVIRATRELKKSLMKHLFTYGPVSIAEAENVPLKETEIGMVPEGWELVRLGEVVTFSSKPRDLNLSAHDKVPFVPMEYIPDERTDINRYQMKKPGEIGSGTFFFKGDLLVAKITPSFENGKQCIANNLPSDFAYATTEVWPLHETNRADLLYLFYYLKRKEVRANIAGKMEGSTGRQRVPRRVLQSLYVPLPPLPIQKQITHIPSLVDGKIEPEENKKQALEALFKTLLTRFMTGKIRVSSLEVPV